MEVRQGSGPLAQQHCPRTATSTAQSGPGSPIGKEAWTGVTWDTNVTHSFHPLHPPYR